MDLQAALQTRRHGAVRREVRRPRARHPHRRLLHRAVRRHPSRRHRPDRALQGRRRGRGGLRRAPHRGGHRRGRARATWARRRPRCASPRACSRSRRSSCPGGSQKLLDEQKQLEKQLAQLETQARAEPRRDLVAAAQEVAGVPVLAARLDGLDPDGLRSVVDTLRDRLRSGRHLLGSAVDGKVSLVAAVSKDLTKRFPAGKLVQEVAKIGGRRRRRPARPGPGRRQGSRRSSTTPSPRCRAGWSGRRRRSPRHCTWPPSARCAR